MYLKVLNENALKTVAGVASNIGKSFAGNASKDIVVKSAGTGNLTQTVQDTVLDPNTTANTVADVGKTAAIKKTTNSAAGKAFIGKVKDFGGKVASKILTKGATKGAQNGIMSRAASAIGATGLGATAGTLLNGATAVKLAYDAGEAYKDNMRDLQDKKFNADDKADFLKNQQKLINKVYEPTTTKRQAINLINTDFFNNNERQSMMRYIDKTKR